MLSIVIFAFTQVIVVWIAMTMLRVESLPSSTMSIEVVGMIG